MAVTNTVAHAIEPPPIDQLLSEFDQLKRPPDLSFFNLVCAADLPGGPSHEPEHYLKWLDDAATAVDLETERNYHRFLDAPAAFGNSQARFCMVCLVTVLQRRFGVTYNPKWKGITPDSKAPDGFGVDAGDLFVHAIIEGVGGTCGSLPVLYVAVGRRLGYPLRLVKAARHLFVRWDDPDGSLWFHPDRFNVEATGPGIHFLPDDHYRNWPHSLSEEDIDAGIFLRSLSAQEECAEFIAARAHCLRVNGRIADAAKMLETASRLSPRNKYFAASSRMLRAHLVMRQRGYASVNAPMQTSGQEAIGPFWLKSTVGERLLVQIVTPVIQSFDPPPNLGIHLVRQMLRTPNGLHVEAWVPLHGSGPSMTAYWVRLPDGRCALLHKTGVESPFRNRLTSPSIGHLGQPVLPQTDLRLGGAWTNIGVEDGLPFHERAHIASQIQETVRCIQNPESAPGLPELPRLALPAGPVVPRLPQLRTGVSLIN